MIKKYLYPEEIYVSKEPTEVITILGSCVSVCLFDPELKTGGINHYVLPDSTRFSRTGQYGIYAVPELIQRMIRMGAKPSGLQAKIFGGAMNKNLLPQFNVGLRNIALAKRILHEYEIPIVKSCVGTPFAQKIVFYTATGNVHVKPIKVIRKLR